MSRDTQLSPIIDNLNEPQHEEKTRQCGFAHTAEATLQIDEVQVQSGVAG